jgi:V8-like Glu-specific endopeptidase
MPSRARRGMASMALLAPLGVLLATGCAASHGPPGIPDGRHFNGTPAVGPLFPAGSAAHTCTASVISSTGGNLLITAAHCISGTGHGYTFAPGYHSGVEPFGTWTVVRAFGAPEWMVLQAPQSDVAFLVVAPHHVNGRPQQIQDVTGGNLLGTAPPSGQEVTVPAYAAGLHDDPISCTARVYRRGRYPAFDCNSYVNGSSGSPWLMRTSHGWATVGVIGGLHQGGCHPWTSYSASFDSVTLRTYSRVAAGAKSIFPIAGSDGC